MWSLHRSDLQQLPFSMKLSRRPKTAPELAVNRVHNCQEQMIKSVSLLCHFIVQMLQSFEF